jgi:hypothetical protein
MFESMQVSESIEKGMKILMEERVDIHQPVSYSKRELVEMIYLSLTLNFLPPSPLLTT